jgi:predicted amidohydrolase
LFNLGYRYQNENYAAAETLDGPTATWMKNTAARLGVHLAGTLLLRDEKDIFNSLLLWAPDGRYWRYDKSYPWGWERAYFRAGAREPVLAATDLGVIGLLICWDIAHRKLWRDYAGQVDLMVVSSCPPDVSNPTYHFKDGATVTFNDLGPVARRLTGEGRRVFVDHLLQQTKWMGVPTVVAGGAGRADTPIPAARPSLGSMLTLAPGLGKYWAQADEVRLTCDYLPACRVVNAQGETVAQAVDTLNDAVVVAEAALADIAPQPQLRQPRAPIMPLTFISSDVILPRLTAPLYRQGARAAWGTEMAPHRPVVRRRLPWVILGVAAVLGLAWWWQRRRR